MLRNSVVLVLCCVLSYVAYSSIAATRPTLADSNDPVTSKPQDASSSREAAAEKDVDVHRRFVEECVHISPGQDTFPSDFRMGGDDGGPLAAPVRTVEMKTPFRICRYEVTQELYRSVMRSNPSRWQGKRNSVEMVLYTDAERFCLRLTDELHRKELIKPSEIVRLPTETEWEYCCRAGTMTRYSFGDSATVEGDKDPQASILNEYAWHTGNAAGNDPAVGVLKPNAWGLYDMHGYLSEFVSDASPALTDGKRVIRGGSWKDDYSRMTCSYRASYVDGEATDAIGFRCVITEQTSSPR